jgi:hypothetical protein
VGRGYVFTGPGWREFDGSYVDAKLRLIASSLEQSRSERQLESSRRLEMLGIPDLAPVLSDPDTSSIVGFHLVWIPPAP